LNETGVEIREGSALADSQATPPDDWFDRQWAMTLLGRALASVESECEAEGKLTQFQTLSPWLTGEAEHGDQAALAEKAGVPINTLKSTIHRLRRRFREAVKTEISRTLSDSVDVDTEMAELFAALGGGEPTRKKK
jgi:RNA polymerase sigma-70 factor (ECF subfamily)